MKATIDTPKRPARCQQRIVQPWKAGDKLLCIDDQGWLKPDPGFEHLSPQKGKTYTLREYTREVGVAAVSLMEGNPEHFYRACRFKRVG